jgi:hypothetical protein
MRKFKRNQIMAKSRIPLVAAISKGPPPID